MDHHHPIPPPQSLLPPWASIPSILRSTQKDQEIQDILSKRLFNLAQQWLGGSIAMAYQSTLRLAAQLTYSLCVRGHLFWTGPASGWPTHQQGVSLGEELTEIMLVNSSSLQPPRRWKMVIWILGGPVLSWWLSKHKCTLPLCGSVLKGWKEFADPLLLAAFYIGGAYHGLWTRMLGLRYIFMRRLSDTERQEWDVTSASYWLAGVLLLLRTLVKVIPTLQRQFLDGPKESTKDDEISASEKFNSDPKTINEVNEINPRKKCMLCLSPRFTSTCTPCGHLYCWSCITEWIRNGQPHCPYCRQDSASSQLMRLND